MLIGVGTKKDSEGNNLRRLSCINKGIPYGFTVVFPYLLKKKSKTNCFLLTQKYVPLNQDLLCSSHIGLEHNATTNK